MPDYHCSPLWWDGEPGRIGNIDPAEIGLSSDLSQALWAWAARFDETLNQDDPAVSRFANASEFAAFARDGAQLEQRVREELSEGWTIRYLPPEG